MDDTFVVCKMNKKTLCLLFLSLMFASTCVIGARIYPDGKYIYDTKSKERHSSEATRMHIDHFKIREKKSFLKDFEPRPSGSAYSDDQNPENKISFVQNSEQEPTSTGYVGNKNLTAYVRNLKPQNKNSSTKEFQSKQSDTTYMKDLKSGEDKKSFQEDFEPRPNLSVYDG
ncbi:organ-specific protein S2-like [Andrographis paniculata]|uniref:organ-specific protein S2-like n=1 Tax=Andrographis paniculata TaxID=175694 RepID=UPI0021E77435|nr:organ-specific protein S2-like [Andrographis paniculata]